MPTSQAAPETSMNSCVLVRAAGTPTWREASLLPPTANVQLPNLAEPRIHTIVIVKTAAQTMRTQNSAGEAPASISVCVT